MTAKELYRVVGQIEDDLILAANEEPTRKRKPAAPLWALAAAACLCLVCVGAFRYFLGTSIIWNEGPGTSVSISKFAIPEGSVPRELTKAEAEDYYQIGPFPETLGPELCLSGPDTFLVYMDGDGAPVYDAAQLWYTQPDGSASVCVALSRVSPSGARPERASRIQGVPVWLTASEELPGYLAYSAQWDRNGTSVRVTEDGLDETGFIALVEELLSRGGKENR